MKGWRGVEEQPSSSAGLRRWGRRSLLGLATALSLWGSASFALGQEASSDRPGAAEAEEAISLLRSPYCPGFMLEVCPSPQASALRDSIYDLADQGYSSEELVEWMIANHGEEWRGLPKRSGVGMWVWIIPPLAVLVGLGAFVGWLRASRRDGTGAAPLVQTPISEDERAELAAAMREWEESGQEDV